jgi:hypothetical protein
MPPRWNGQNAAIEVKVSVLFRAFLSTNCPRSGPLMSSVQRRVRTLFDSQLPQEGQRLFKGIHVLLMPSGIMGQPVLLARRNDLLLVAQRFAGELDGGDAVVFLREADAGFVHRLEDFGLPPKDRPMHRMHPSSRNTRLPVHLRSEPTDSFHVTVRDGGLQVFQKLPAVGFLLSGRLAESGDQITLTNIVAHPAGPTMGLAPVSDARVSAFGIEYSGQDLSGFANRFNWSG